MTDRYFAYDPETGFETFSTEHLAITFANEIIDCYRDESSEGWDELVTQVCWGEIKQMATMFDKQAAPEDSGFDYICNYALTDIPPPPATATAVPDGYHLLDDATLRRAIVSLIDRVTKNAFSCNETAVEQLRFMNEIAAAQKGRIDEQK